MDAPPQQVLPLPSPELGDRVPLLPARMVCEYQYCPRLAYLMWAQSEWHDSADTVEGRHVHRRVDRPRGDLPEPDALPEEERLHVRSLTLSSEQLGVIARIDLVEAADGEVVPVDYKRGKRPHVARGAYDPERVQLCIQGLLLEENGYRCSHGILYYVGSRERVRVIFDEDLRRLTRTAIDGLRLMTLCRRVPPPLEDSPKCPRCSLVAICLPDEVRYLSGEGGPPRPLAVAREEALPLYVQDNRARITKKGDVLEVKLEDKVVASARLVEVSQVVLQGNASITTPALRELMAREIPVTWLSYGGWFVGHTVGLGHRNAELRDAQYRAAFDPGWCLRLARELVRAKILNSRTLLRRNWRAGDKPEGLLAALKREAERARRASSMDQLLGIEGSAAQRYFSAFSGMLVQGEDGMPAFDFHARRRRPPTDPVNALLSYAYSLLTRAWAVAVTAVGLDVYRGFYHQSRYGKPALALDLMEPFRPLLADSTVIQVINNGEIARRHFVSAGGAVSLNPDGRRRFIAAFERRLSQEITHPLFGYRLSYRRLLELQARLLGRFLLGELPYYPQIVTR